MRDVGYRGGLQKAGAESLSLPGTSGFVRLIFVTDMVGHRRQSRSHLWWLIPGEPGLADHSGRHADAERGGAGGTRDCGVWQRRSIQNS